MVGLNLKCALSAWLALLVASAGHAEVRTMVFAADYRQQPDPRLHLENTLIDARAIGTLFKKLKIADVQLVLNPRIEDWKRQSEALLERLRADDFVVVYYAGHAIQVNGRNYFLASDGTSLIAAEQLISAIQQRAQGAVFFIDACRDNPFRAAAPGGASEPELQVQDLSAGATRGWNRIEADPSGLPPVQAISLQAAGAGVSGLTQMNSLRGSNAIVVFSTDPGNVALDGNAGDGSPFARAVTAELAKRQSLDSAIRRITARVASDTGGRQSPWRQGDLGSPLFLAGQPRFPIP